MLPPRRRRTEPGFGVGRAPETLLASIDQIAIVSRIGSSLNPTRQRRSALLASGGDVPARDRTARRGGAAHAYGRRACRYVLEEAGHALGSLAPAPGALVWVGARPSPSPRIVDAVVAAQAEVKNSRTYLDAVAGSSKKTSCPISAKRWSWTSCRLVRYSSALATAAASRSP